MIGMMAADDEPPGSEAGPPLPAEPEEPEESVPAPVAVDDAANLVGDFLEDQIVADAAIVEQLQVAEEADGPPLASNAEDPVDELVLPEPEVVEVFEGPAFELSLPRIARREEMRDRLRELGAGTHGTKD